MANVTAVKGEHVALGNATLAQVNAGYCIVPGDGATSLAVTGGWIVTRGAQGAQCTSIDIKDTAGVVAVAFPVALLVQNAFLRFGAATTVNTYAAQGMTPGKGLEIQKTGTAITAAMTLDYCVKYVHTP